MTPLTFSALGTAWFVEIFGEVAEERRQVVYDDLAAFFVSYEARFSRFRTDSLVSTLNRERVLSSNDKELIAMLRLGQDFYQNTSGRFNILLGNHLSARGYNSDYTFKSGEAPKTIASPLSDLNITEEKITLTDGDLDLGGIGKGYAIDLIADRLKNIHQLPYFLINGGGDMYATCDQDQKSITIYLEHPTLEKIYLGTTTIFHQGFAASSPHKRKWKNGEEITHHIVGENIFEDASYIIAKDATTADVLATTALLSSLADFDLIAKTCGANYASFTIEKSILTQSVSFRLIPLK